MRRGRFIGLLVALVAAAAVFTGAPAALADSGNPADICATIQAAAASGQYTQAQIDAWLQDPTVQGYCGPITVIIPTCTPSSGNTGSGGMGGTNGCTPPCTSTSGSTSNGSTGSNGSSNGCTPPPTTPPAPSVNTQPPIVVSSVAGTQYTQVVPVAKSTPVAHVKGAQHTVHTPKAAAVAPLATTRKSGTLPFTGAQLGLFALVGLALVATGVLLRKTSPKRDRA
jgi:hypothetical protein